ncbi:hypothetical protein OAC86_00375 [bacterium]|nr:hypothetical protein [bacterium]MDB9899980.1 hypothetical protein [bacterium]
MVLIEDINNKVDDNLDDFYKDKERFRNLKLLIDFKPIEIEAKDRLFNPGKPKFKKKQRTSVYIKPKSSDNTSLF